MEPTLDAALNDLFGNSPLAAGAAAALPSAALQPALERARVLIQAAQKAMQQGDWDKFGKAMEALKTLLASPPT